MLGKKGGGDRRDGNDSERERVVGKSSIEIVLVSGRSVISRVVPDIRPFLYPVSGRISV